MPPILIAQTPNAGSLNYRYLASDTRGLDSRTVASYLAEFGAESGVGPDFLWAWSETVQKSSGRAARISAALVGIDTALLPPKMKERILSQLRLILGRLNGIVPEDWSGETSAIREVPALAELMPSEWRDLPSMPIRVRRPDESKPPLPPKEPGWGRYFLLAAIVIGLIAAGSGVWFHQRDRGASPVSALNAPIAEDPFADDRMVTSLLGHGKSEDSFESILRILTAREPRISPEVEELAVDHISKRIGALGRLPPADERWKVHCERVEDVGSKLKKAGGRIAANGRIARALKEFRLRYMNANYELINGRWNEYRTVQFQNPLIRPAKTEEDFRNFCGSILDRFEELRGEFPDLATLEARSQGRLSIKFGETIDVSCDRLPQFSGNWNDVRTVEFVASIDSLPKEGSGIGGKMAADGNSARSARITLAKPPLYPIDGDLSNLNIRICGFHRPGEPQEGRRSSDREFSFSIREAFSSKTERGTWRCTKGGITLSGTWSFDPPLPDMPAPEKLGLSIGGVP